MRVVRFLSFSPAVVLWVVHNEGWGQADTTAAVTAAVRAVDPTRLLTDASGWRLSVARQPSSHRFQLFRPCLPAMDCGDTIDVHAYPGPFPSATQRHRWYPRYLWRALRWGQDETRASVLGEFGGFSYRDYRGGDDSGWGYQATASCEQLVGNVSAVWRRPTAPRERAPLGGGVHPAQRHRARAQRVAHV